MVWHNLIVYYGVVSQVPEERDGTLNWIIEEDLRTGPFTKVWESEGWRNKGRVSLLEAGKSIYKETVMTFNKREAWASGD